MNTETFFVFPFTLLSGERGEGGARERKEMLGDKASN